jgi:hypothetical protein
MQHLKEQTKIKGSEKTKTKKGQIVYVRQSRFVFHIDIVYGHIVFDEYLDDLQVFRQYSIVQSIRFLRISSIYIGSRFQQVFYDLIKAVFAGYVQQE